VSNGAPRGDGADRQGLPALESAVNRTVRELRELRRKVADGAQRSAELEALLASFQSGAESPDRMRQRLERLEEENRDLRARMTQGRETVERLLARIQFLENQR
jgi:predicted RNase H-like nuclease (RuvC/YqgF family)